LILPSLFATERQVLPDLTEEFKKQTPKTSKKSAGLVCPARLSHQFLNGEK